MRSLKTRGIICLTDPQTRLEYRVSRIDYTVYEDESFTYVFTPNYSVIELLGPPLFQGIPGLDLDLRRPQYVRENCVPVFISERTPAENREDVRELLDAVGMDYLDQLEWLIRTDTRYSGDNFYVIRAGNDADGARIDVSGLFDCAESAGDSVRLLLEAICRGDMLEGDGFRVDDANRKEAHALLRSIYVGECARRTARCTDTKRDGRELKVDEIRVYAVIDAYQKGHIVLTEALDELDISRATFFRWLKRHCEMYE